MTPVARAKRIEQKRVLAPYKIKVSTVQHYSRVAHCPIYYATLDGKIVVDYGPFINRNDALNLAYDQALMRIRTWPKYKHVILPPPRLKP